jgi:hypothetical protein
MPFELLVISPPIFFDYDLYLDPESFGVTFPQACHLSSIYCRVFASCQTQLVPSKDCNPVMS